MRLIVLITLLVLRLGAADAKRPEPQGSAQPPARPRIGAAAQRNENVAIYQIDNNAIKEANIRLGTRTTLLSQWPAEVDAYAAEHGQVPADPGFLPAIAISRTWHAELFHMHQNSVFNARTFFQAGPVQPSRRNFYGVRGATEAGSFGFLTLNFWQRKVRGMVNGNVLVPLASERTPLAADPAVRAVVQRFLAAYPASLPNRPDFDMRALNTNAPQRIDEIDGSARLDRDAGGGRLSALHSISRSNTQAFQLVAGQNPNMDIHSHRSRLSWTRALDARTELSLAAQFQRTASLLASEPRAVGPKVRIGFQIQELGPDSQFPIDRAQNTFRYAALARRQTARHAFSLGGSFARFQLNGVEGSNLRGYFQFTNNFGRTAIENLRHGTPTTYEVGIGDLDRGFRNSTLNLFFADRVQLRPALQLYYGLRWNAETAPVEVQDRDIIPYDSDWNNFSPRLSLAWQPGAGWVVRTGATVSFAAIPPVTYQQIRMNLPRVRYVQVQNPNLLNPLAGVDLESASARSSPTILARELASSYSWQWSVTAERKVFDYAALRLGYTGSRSYKLMYPYVTNRAEAVPGVPLTTGTVDQRRPDPRFYEMKWVTNGGTAYFDAAQASLDLPLRRGLLASATYTFSKAIDLGADFTYTAAHNDLNSTRSQWQYESFADRKGLSNFDSPHALQLSYSYDLPAPSSLRWALAGWQVSGATLLKSGTPLTLFVGSDAPGFGNVDGGPSDRPSILDPSILGATISHPDRATEILRRDRFDFIHPGELRGTLARGAFRKAGISNWNAALTKQWAGAGAREWRLVLRGEAYNLTNTPQFDEPQRNLSSPAFGKITNTLNDGRVMQLSLRLLI